MRNKEIKTRYYDAWNFNTRRIIKRFEKLIFDNGGYIVSSWQKELDNFHFVARFSNYKNETWTDEKICFDSNYDSYIVFMIDGFVYYVQFDNNPFFEHYYIKQACRHDDANGAYITDYGAYSNELNREFLYDCLFSFDCTNDEIKEIANLFFNQIISAPASQTETKRVRKYYGVGNKHYYNNCPVVRKKSYFVIKEA